MVVSTILVLIVLADTHHSYSKPIREFKFYFSQNVGVVRFVLANTGFELVYQPYGWFGVYRLIWLVWYEILMF